MRFCSFLLGLLFCLILPGLSFGLNGHNDSLKSINEIELSSFNDNWGAAYTPTFDNLRSLGFGIYFKNAKNNSLSITYSGLTNNSFQDISQKGRLDELAIKGNYHLNNKIISINYGLVIYNNLRMKLIQEYVHNLIGNMNHDLDYIFTNQINALLGVKAQPYTINLIKNGDLNITLNPQIEINYLTNNYFEISPKAPINIINKGQKIIGFSAGYKFVNNQSNEVILENLNRSESGLILEYKMNIGPIAYSWTAYPNQNFSLGTYSIILKKQAIKYNKPDIYLELGAMLESG